MNPYWLLCGVVDRFRFTPVFAASGVAYPIALLFLIAPARRRAEVFSAPGRVETDAAPDWDQPGGHRRAKRDNHLGI